MAVLTLPTDPVFRDSTFGLESNTRVFESPLTKHAQTVEMDGARWTFRGRLPPMTRAQAVEWQVFLVQLRGMAGRFYIGDPDAKTARGTAGGTPLVNGASQTGVSLVTDGWNASEGVMKKGDYIAYDLSATQRALHLITADVTSDGSGNATLSIEPPIRTSPANNAAIIVASPTCVMRLTDDNQARWDVNHLQHYGLSLAAVEIFT